MKKILAQVAFATAMLTVSTGLSAAPAKPPKPTPPTKPTPPPPNTGPGDIVQCMADGNSMQVCLARG